MIHLPRISRAHAALFLMVVIWGINFSVAKAALTELSPLAFNALRFPLAALVVYVLLRSRGPIDWPAPQDRWRVIGLGILGNAFYQQFFIFGLDRTRAGTASVLLAGTPIVTALLSAMLGHERVTPRAWVGVFATCAGIALVVFAGGGGEQQGGSLLGEALMIAATCSWALYTVGSRDLIGRYGSVRFTAWTLWVGAVILCITGLPALLTTDIASVSGRAWTGVVYSGALSIGVAYLIWYYGVRLIGNTRTATYSNLVPVIALLAAWAHLGEVPLPGQVLGAAIIIGGITIAQARPSRPRAT
ncbi:MAG: DMT family transporter [Gemmatimonadota bacterium]